MERSANGLQPLKDQVLKRLSDGELFVITNVSQHGINVIKGNKKTRLPPNSLRQYLTESSPEARYICIHKCTVKHKTALGHVTSGVFKIQLDETHKNRKHLGWHEYDADWWVLHDQA